jgi:glycosyltransferase involved in cell wall biosynthesis
MVRACAIVPALNAEATLGSVVDDVRDRAGLAVLVVDDGSDDDTARVARAHGAALVRHDRNRGKGAALRSGLLEARARGFDVAVTLDADGQHPAESARAVLEASRDPGALVLGVRDLARDGAPRSNRFGNAVSNFFLSRLMGRSMSDTQCGLRRYPVEGTLALRAQADGYAFEGEVVLRAAAAGIPLVEVPIDVRYSLAALRQSHFRLSSDPARIAGTVLFTVLELRLRDAAARAALSEAP